MSAKKEIRGILSPLSEAGTKLGQTIASIWDEDVRADLRAEREHFDHVTRRARVGLNDARADLAAEAMHLEEDRIRAAMEDRAAALRNGAGRGAAAEMSGAERFVENHIVRHAKNGARTAARIIEVPVTYALKPVRWISEGVGGTIARRPIAALAVAGTAATVGIVGTIAGAVARNNHRKQEMKAQALANAMQGQAGNAPVSYMNSASQADVEARIAADRANGTAPGSQAEALAARQAVPAPEASVAGPAY